MLNKEAWVAKLLGTHLSIQVNKKVKFSRRDISSLAVKGLNKESIRSINYLCSFFYQHYRNSNSSVPKRIIKPDNSVLLFGIIPTSQHKKKQDLVPNLRIRKSI